MPSTKAKSVDNQLSFEEAIAQLQQIVNDMEQQQLPLDEAIQAYEKGMQLTAICRQKLEQAEQKVKVLQDNQWLDANKTKAPTSAADRQATPSSDHDDALF
ncbi:exodeoxyribonuclease VII small subunit [Brackiella oedipodis]|uniref:exodeoxyribonuclease VII small subunit n=1 Tax=Brackiella oedipodis TaxID=124225 RepID=UPI00048DD4F5|nr:exodeoxyribonuclease VII small subunit [Brackiella oedipodis]